jgi:hypothetical protein
VRAGPGDAAGEIKSVGSRRVLLDVESEVAELNWTSRRVESDRLTALRMGYPWDPEVVDAEIVAVPYTHVDECDVFSGRPLVETIVPHRVLHHDEDGVAFHFNASRQIAMLIDHLDDDQSTAPIADEPVDHIYTLQPVREVCYDLGCGQTASGKSHIPARATVAKTIADAAGWHTTDITGF